MTNTNFEVEKFNGTNNFGMWQCEVLDILYQHELDNALKEEKLEEMEDKAYGAFRLCLSKEQKYLFMKKAYTHNTWKELENKFLNKSN